MTEDKLIRALIRFRLDVGPGVEITQLQFSSIAAEAWAARTVATKRTAVPVPVEKPEEPIPQPERNDMVLYAPGIQVGISVKIGA